MRLVRLASDSMKLLCSRSLMALSILRKQIDLANLGLKCGADRTAAQVGDRVQARTYDDHLALDAVGQRFERSCQAEQGHRGPAVLTSLTGEHDALREGLRAGSRDALW